MSIDQKLSRLVGSWKGTYRLHVPWMPVKLKESESTAIVRSKMNGQFLYVEYTWYFDGNPQEGLLIMGSDPNSDAVQAVWTDSWHSKDVLMLCNGNVDDNGSLAFTGTYSVPEHPDRSWRTQIIPGVDSFSCAMYNIAPDGAEKIAVEMDLTRMPA